MLILSNDRFSASNSLIFSIVGVHCGDHLCNLVSSPRALEALTPEQCLGQALNYQVHILRDRHEIPLDECDLDELIAKAPLKSNRIRVYLDLSSPANPGTPVRVEVAPSFMRGLIQRQKPWEAPARRVWRAAGRRR